MAGYIPIWQPHDPYQNVRAALVGEDVELYHTSGVFKAWVDAMAQSLELQRQAMVLTCSENEYLREVALNCLQNHPPVPSHSLEDPS